MAFQYLPIKNDFQLTVVTITTGLPMNYDTLLSNKYTLQGCARIFTCNIFRPKIYMCVFGLPTDPIFYVPTLTPRIPTVIGLNNRVFTNQGLKKRLKQFNRKHQLTACFEKGLFPEQKTD